MKVNTYLIVTRYLSSGTSNRRLYVILGCERGGANKQRTKPRVDDEEEEVQVKRRGPYRTKKCGCPFKVKGEQMAMCENWQLFIHVGRHNHVIGLYNHGHSQAAKLIEEQLIHIEQFRKSHNPPRNILQFFREKNVDCAVRYVCQKIYYIVAKIKKDRMQGRKTVEEVFCLSAQRGYTVFYRNCEDNNLLSDIVVAHLTSIQKMRTWPYVQYAIVGSRRDDRLATTYRWVFQKIKHLYFSNAMSTENEQDVNAHESMAIITDRESGLMPVIN
ncbi:hypothetical protein M9H77_01774 [Catharanthus roseus]|uniref:Uncharacterized protein n=1 Tax=Catharanthus roseus TaxID=4058 RepID=A0ACC0C6R7_CATRO|nr:hypothetical protein M9H77_01774 [Catharanthus roseus]